MLTTTVALTAPQRQALLSYALVLHCADINIIPVNYQKQPVGPWKQYQSKRSTMEDITRWASMPEVGGFATTCGQISGGQPGYGLTIIDCDVVEGFFDEFCALLPRPEIFPLMRSGSGGLHMAFRSPLLAGNAKLAWSPNDREPTGREIALETRGEGGIIVLPYSMHPSGKLYEEVHLSLADVPTISLEEAEYMIRAAQSLDKAPISKLSAKKIEAAERTVSSYQNTGDSVIDAYNDMVDIHTSLTRYDYTPFGSRYTRPGEGASPGSVVILKDKRGRLCSFHHSSNDPMNGDHLRDSFDLFAHYEHSDDIKAAVKSAAVITGKTRTPNNNKSTGSKSSSPKKGAQNGQIPMESEPESNTEDQQEKKKLELLDYLDIWLAWQKKRGQVYAYHQQRGTYYDYQNGVYNEIKEETVMQHINAAMIDSGFRNLGSQIVEQVGLQYRRMWSIGKAKEDITTLQLNTGNGILNLMSGEFVPHTPDFFSTIQSTANYDPQKVAYDFLDFLEKAVPNETNRKIIQMFAGLCLTGITSTQKALMLIGEGGTGKGTLTYVLEQVLGKLSTAAGLEKLQDGSFMMGTLVGKRLCVISELNPRVDWLTFKRIVGEDTMMIDIKNKQPYATKLDIKMIVLSNEIPFMGPDATNDSIVRRFLIIPFNVIPSSRDPELRDRLTTPDELSGVLNWMLEGLHMLAAASWRFPDPEESTVQGQMKEKSNHCIEYTGEKIEACNEAFGVGSEEVYRHYRNWAIESGFIPYNLTNFRSKMFPAALKEVGIPYTYKRRADSFKWLGVRIR